ncbi:MAG: PilN domain-containing protein, partial [Acidobacteriaceae bacterium]|nr:PilN domain-containing protein [Acidobacteriaceae bacterium]
LANARRQSAQLRTVVEQVQQYDARKTQLLERVELIEQWRARQAGPVHLLDEVSRALPPSLWLTELRQRPSGGDVLIAGRCGALTDLSDFVGALERSGYFKRSIEIVNTVADSGKSGMDVISFQIKAVFQRPSERVLPRTVSQAVDGEH